MLDNLYSTCLERCKKMDARGVPIDLLKNYIDILKDGFIKGLENENTIS